MDVLRNSLAGLLADVSLVTEHPFSAAVRKEGRRTETIAIWTCPWVYFQLQDMALVAKQDQNQEKN